MSYEAEQLKSMLDSAQRIGFTGTQRGLSESQREFLNDYFAVNQQRTVLVHGDCIGADAEAHQIATAHGLWTEIHPCTIEHKRAHCHGTIVYSPLPPMDRNQYIVDTCPRIVGCPGEEGEVVRSGTWATLRRARKAGRMIIICRPSGRLSQLRAKRDP